MLTYEFTKAAKSQSKLRLAIFGPSGSGKTFTALRLAKGMTEPNSGKIAVIDTEFGSASKYADRFGFDVLNLDEPKVDNLIAAMKSARAYDVLIIDSLTHSWKELLIQVDQLAKAKYKGNSWAAWSDGTPVQSKMVEAILRFPGHLIATMRTKTEWTINQDTNGKSSPTRVGLAPEQGKGIEYEFDILMEISPEHAINVIKDRTGQFQDRIIQDPGEDFGKEILAWLSEGEPYAPVRTKEDLIEFGKPLGLNPSQIGEALKSANIAFDPALWEDMTKAVVGFANEYGKIIAN